MPDAGNSNLFKWSCGGDADFVENVDVSKELKCNNFKVNTDKWVSDSNGNTS